jgi:citrate lyase subunit beta/citryl-CoA lyase
MTNHLGKRSLPAWRSLMYVPVTNERFVEAAHTRKADALILDLEDSIALKRKDDARQLVSAASHKVARGGADVLVRINRPWRIAIRDIEAVVSPSIYGLVLPKISCAKDVQIISEIVSEMEQLQGIKQGALKFVALVETANAFSKIEEIAHADSRIVAMSVGGEDFASSCGMDPDGEGLYVPKMHMLIHARAAGVIPLGFIGTVSDYSDVIGLKQAAERARKLGFMGATCVHPGQVVPINDAYSPNTKEINQARKVVEAAAKAEQSGVGAYEVDGRMVDFPVVERATDILARHDAIEQRAKLISGK